MTDTELVCSCLEGDMESYRTLMDRYREPAMALALNMLTNFQDAEDACQEGFLKAYYNLHRFDIARSFKNWLYAVLANVCLDQIRKKRRFLEFIRHSQSEQRSETGSRPAAPVASGSFDFGRLRGLSPKERACLYLWSQEGYSGEEIAAALGCSRQTAYVHLFRARAKLKRALDEATHETA